MPTVKEVQLSFLARQARLEYELFYDLDLPKLSQHNIARLRALLRETRPSGLTSQEVRLVQCVFDHSTFSHGTEYLQDIQNNQNTLQSLQMRVKAQQQTQNRHTAAGSRTDSYVFFAYGKQIPAFLSQDIDKVSFNPSHLQNNNALLYQRSFVTWSPGAGLQRRTSEPLLLGECRYYHTHSSDSDKQYIYQREGQAPFIWSVTAQQEILYGKDILWGLAYQMVLHLRYIGGSYQQHVLDTLSATSFQVLKEVFMPVNAYPELKLPLKFNIAGEGVRLIKAVPVDLTQPLSFEEQLRAEYVQDFREGKTLERFFDKKENLYSHPERAQTNYDKKLLLQEAVRKADLKLIDRILSENNFDINENYTSGTLLMHAINDIYKTQQRMLVVKRLIEKGADPNACNTDGENSYYKAVKQKDKALFEYLLTVTCPHAQDPYIKKLPVLNKDKVMLLESNILDLICASGLVDWLALAVVHGANIHHFPCSLYRHAAKNGHVAMVKALIAQHVPLDEVRGSKTPLIIFAEQGCIEGVQLLLDHHVDVHVEYDGKTALDVAIEKKQQAVIDLLAPYNIKKNQMQYKGKKWAVVAVVTAEDPKTGKRVVLVGQRRNRDNTLNDEYQFPGGLVDTSDKDFISASKRELKEETGISLSSPKLIGEYTQHTVATYSQVYDEVHYDIRFIHFHLLINPDKLHVKADDDLGHVKWLPIENMRMATDCYQKKRYVFQEGNLYTLFNQSNGIVLEGLHYGRFDKPAFDQAMLVENFGYKKLMEYTRADDVARIEQLIAHRTPCDGALLSLAASSGSRNAVEFYLTFNPEFMNVSPHPAVSAALGNHWDIFERLDNGLMDAYSEAMILEHCINSKNLVRVRYCLDNFKVNINARLAGHQYFMTAAVITGDLEIVKMLHQYGAKVNPKFIGVDDNGIKIKAPLHVALARKQVDLAIYLIDSDADINCGDNITQEALLKGAYVRLVKVFNPMFQEAALPPIDVHDRFDFETHSQNKNAVMKAVATPGCEAVVQHIINHKLQMIDVEKLDRGTLTRYKDIYPELFALLPPESEIEPMLEYKSFKLY